MSALDQDPLVASAIAQLQELEHDLNFPHILDKREQTLVKEVELLRMQLGTAEVHLGKLQVYRNALPERIEQQRLRVQELRESASKRVVVGQQNKVNDVLAHALKLGISLEDLAACLKDKA